MRTRTGRLADQELGADGLLDGQRRFQGGNGVGENRAMRLAHRLEYAAA